MTDYIARRSHATFILNKRWPEAPVGEQRKYHGPIGAYRSGPVDWVKTDDGWDVVTDIPSVKVLRAQRERKVREDAMKVLDTLPPLKRYRVLMRLVRLFGRTEQEQDR